MIKSNHPTHTQAIINQIITQTAVSLLPSTVVTTITAWRLMKGETYPVEQSSIENVLPSIRRFIQPPSYEKAPKLMDQGAKNSKSYRECSSSKFLPSICQVTISHVPLEPLTARMCTFPPSGHCRVRQPLGPHSVCCGATTWVLSQKKPTWHITLQSRVSEDYEILLNFKTLYRLSRHWPLDLPKSSYGTFTTKWIWRYRNYSAEISQINIAQRGVCETRIL